MSQNHFLPLIQVAFFPARRALLSEHFMAHFLVVTFPAQGHINPALQFAKHLVKLGARVTFVTSIFAQRQMTQTSGCPIIDGLSFLAFSDGFDEGKTDDFNAGRHMSEIRRRSSETLPKIIESNANEGHPITFLVYSLLLPWVAEVARVFHIPSALLWIQPASLLDIYYHYFNDYGNAIRDSISNPSYSIKLPGLPPLTSRDLPSHFITTKFALPSFQEHIEALGKERKPKILINTFDALEPEALEAIDKLDMIGIGPLLPSAFLDGNDQSDSSFGGDLFRSTSEDYVKWLKSQPKSSIVYISFGSNSSLPQKQVEEIVCGLLESHFPFLWSVRQDENGKQDKFPGRMEELKKQGMIVSWCSQMEVLSDPSIGCFFTHCGWNSSIESMVSGVPMVGFPQWADQTTNAKLIEDVWKIGLRMNVNEEGIVEGNEIRRCLETVMGCGERAQEMKKNVEKWKQLAREAVKEGGSSDKNLKAFVHQIEGC